jgi:steroid delta-isomerase-like uncharacterized protein
MGQTLDVVNRALEAFDSGDADAVRDAYHADVVLEAPGGVRLTGQVAAAAYNVAFMRAFDDLEVAVHLRVEQDDLLVEEYTMTATHGGALATPRGEIPPTGNRVTLRVAEVYRVHEGKIIENRLYFDEALLMRQLGA